MNDRGIIKWQPFNSVINSNDVINSILKEKEKINMPKYFDEEVNNLEEKIIEAFYNQNKVLITYFKNGKFFKIESKIQKIDQVYKMVYLDKKKLFFKQIVNIQDIIF